MSTSRSDQGLMQREGTPLHGRRTWMSSPRPAYRRATWKTSRSLLFIMRSRASVAHLVVMQRVMLQMHTWRLQDWVYQSVS